MQTAPYRITVPGTLCHSASVHANPRSATAIDTSPSEWLTKCRAT